MNKNIHIIGLLIVFLTLITTFFGLFNFGEANPRIFTNIYGDSVSIYGKGLYKNDAAFFAPIFKGTDFTILILCIPLMFIAVLYDKKRRSRFSGMLLTAMLAFFLYYGASISFGNSYNALFLVYMALFSLSLVGFIWAMMDVNRRFSDNFTPIKLTAGLKVFLILGGISLFVAWLPDIIQSYFTGKFPLTVYHTPITHVLDMAIISPAIFICFYLLKKKCFLGIQILVVMLVCILLISIMLPIQTIFQLNHGLTLTF